MIDYGEDRDVTFMCFTDVEVRLHRAFQGMDLEEQVSDIVVSSIERQSPQKSDFPEEFHGSLEFVEKCAVFRGRRKQAFVDWISKELRREIYFTADPVDAGRLERVGPIKRPVNYTFFGQHKIAKPVWGTLGAIKPLFYFHGDPFESVIIIEDNRRAKKFIDFYAIKYQIHHF